jgi:hypothetical protein
VCGQGRSIAKVYARGVHMQYAEISTVLIIVELINIVKK